MTIPERCDHGVKLEEDCAACEREQTNWLYLVMGGFIVLVGVTAYALW